MFDRLPKEQKMLIAGIIISVVIGLVVTFGKQFVPSANTSINIEEAQPANQGFPPQIVVHIAGEVEKEGVYKVRMGERILDLINYAGGVKPSADLGGMNLAEALKDGEKVFIPRKQAELNILANLPMSGSRKEQVKTIKININSASESELDSLPGVGPSLAKEIIECRRKQGSFSSKEQIMQVKRLGKKKYERIKGMIDI